MLNNGAGGSNDVNLEEESVVVDVLGTDVTMPAQNVYYNVKGKTVTDDESYHSVQNVSPQMRRYSNVMAVDGSTEATAQGSLSSTSTTTCGMGARKC